VVLRPSTLPAHQRRSTVSHLISISLTSCISGPVADNHVFRACRLA
jgi:hypothetical protein